MKKIMVLIATAVAAMALAANAAAQISVGVGYANETVIDKSSMKLDEGEKGKAWTKDRRNLNGFYIEAAYNWNFTSVAGGDLSLQPGLRYYCLTDRNSTSKANYKGEDYSAKASEKERISDHFIDIPVNVKYAYDFVPGAVKAYAFAGPVLSFGLAAKSVSISKSSYTYDGESEDYTEINRYNLYTGKYYRQYYDEYEDKEITSKGKEDQYRSYNMFDLKLGLGLGVTVAEKVDVKFGYNIGLLNRAFLKNTDDAKNSAHSNVLYFGVSYNF